MKSALEVHQALLAGGVPHEVVRLDERTTSADDLPRVLGLEPGCLAVRCYAARYATRPDAVVAVLVRAGTTPSPAALSRVLGALDVEPCPPDVVSAVTDCADGLVCPVDLPPHVPVLADAAVATTPVVYTAIGDGGLALGIGVRDLLVACRARVASLTPTVDPLAGPVRDLLADVVDLDRIPVPRHAV